MKLSLIQIYMTSQKGKLDLVKRHFIINKQISMEQFI